MLATTRVPVAGLNDWAVEPKWDGWRARVAVDRGKVRVRTRTGRVITSAVPDLAAFGEPDRDLLLDGELVSGAGRLADFYGLSGRLASKRGSEGVVFIVFDLLIDEQPIIDQPYHQRRQALEQLHLRGLIVTPSYPGDDADALLPPARTPAWRVSS